jgi:ubiquinone/menaquinone biosynthesis C-methylase UbiE
LYSQLSLLALDARRMPFQEGSVEMLTTNLGLQNIEEPDSLMRELRRVVGGRFLSISHFYSDYSFR